MEELDEMEDCFDHLRSRESIATSLMEFSRIPLVSNGNSQMSSATTSAVFLWNETDWKPFLLMRNDAIQIKFSNFKNAKSY